MNDSLKHLIATTRSDSGTVYALPGWCTKEKAEAIAQLVLDGGPGKLIVEIGVFGGSSFIPLGLAAKEAGSRAVGIDPWDNGVCLEGTNAPENDEWWSRVDLKRMHSIVEGAIILHSLAGHAETMVATDLDAIGRFSKESIYLLHVDGNHSPQVSRRYIEQWGEKIEDGGYLVMDDIDWPSQAETVKLIEKLYDPVKIDPKWAIYRKVNHGKSGKKR